MVEELIRNNSTYFCISPGARSTPLTIAVARNQRAHAIVAHDERGAAFYALGYGKATGRPAVLICTSGTATANYYPAILEAKNNHIPLIILTADRPPELLNTGANQVVNQDNLYGSNVLSYVTMPCPTEKIPPQFVLTTIDQCHFKACDEQGPVHINCQFREPLAPLDDFLDITYMKPVVTWEEERYPYTVYHESQRSISQKTVLHLASKIAQADKILFVVGKLSSKSEAEPIEKLAEKMNVPIVSDIQSIEYFDSYENIFGGIDNFILLDGFLTSHKPDLIIHFGTMTVSKRYLECNFLHYGIERIVVNEYNERLDPVHSLTEKVTVQIGRFVSSIIKYVVAKPSRYTEYIKNCGEMIQYSLSTVCSDDKALSEYTLIHRQSQLDSNEYILFISNSLAIRVYDRVYQQKGIAHRIYANRGCSGIDGQIATACGVATGYNKPLIITIGDTSLLHDLNSLSFVKGMRNQVIIIVINNGGGAIFSMLPVAQLGSLQEKYFHAPHGLEFQKAAELFDLTYERTTDLISFEKFLQNSMATKENSLIEVIVDPNESVKPIKELNCILQNIDK